jgi:hypothetical protein
MVQEEAEMYKQKFNTMRNGKETSMMDDARHVMNRFPPRDGSENHDDNGHGSMGTSTTSFRTATSRPEFQKGVESVASMGSSLAQHAKTLVGSFACTGGNINHINNNNNNHINKNNNQERTGHGLVSERATEEWRGRRHAAAAAGRDATAATSYGGGTMPPGLEMSHSRMSTRTPTTTTTNTTTTPTSSTAPRHIDV